MLYFAYGSNLDEKQMHARCPHALRGPTAVLQDHALVFSGFSYAWGGAVASVVRSPGGAVPGLLYALSPEELEALDRFEGHPYSYERVQRIVVDRQFRRRRVHVYVQRSGSSPVPPADRYLGVLWRAYGHLGFDRRKLAAAAGVAA